MKRTVFLVEKIDISEGYESVSKIFTTYVAAVIQFKALIANALIFDSIWNLYTDGEVPSGKNILAYAGIDETTDIRMFTRCGKAIYDFPLEKEFLADDYKNDTEKEYTACGGEITFEVGSLIFLLRAVEEES